MRGTSRIRISSRDGEICQAVAIHMVRADVDSKEQGVVSVWTYFENRTKWSYWALRGENQRWLQGF